MRLVPALPAAPPRGTRPADRRARLARTAGQLFATRGYSAVSMAQIADALNVRPSALYRHAPGKAALLAQATETGLRPLLDAARGPAEPLDRWLEALAGAACGERWAGLLWVREYRHLDPPARQQVEALVAELLAALERGLGQSAGEDGAGARARAVTMLLASISFHYLRLPSGRLETWLAATAGRIAACPVAGPAASGAAAPAASPTAAGPAPPAVPRRGSEEAKPDPSGLVSAAKGLERRGQVLARAVELFAGRGYANVSVEQIASAAGIATGTFYNCFAGKRELLAEAFTQAEALLQVEIERAVGAAKDPTQILNGLLDQYVEMVLTRPELTTILVNDNFELDERNRLRAGRIFERLVDRWAAQVELAAGCDPVEARVRAHAVFVIVHGLTLWPPGRRSPIPPEQVRALAATAVRPA
jgi:AcrR family transcriptional regulator